MLDNILKRVEDICNFNPLAAGGILKSEDYWIFIMKKKHLLKGGKGHETANSRGVGGKNKFFHSKVVLKAKQTPLIWNSKEKLRWLTNYFLWLQSFPYSQQKMGVHRWHWAGPFLPLIFHTQWLCPWLILGVHVNTVVRYAQSTLLSRAWNTPRTGQLYHRGLLLLPLNLCKPPLQLQTTQDPWWM